MKSEFYNDYKNARDKSWEIIFKYEIKELPVNMFSLLRKMKVKVYSYKEAQKVIVALGIADNTKNDGFTTNIKNHYVVFYNDAVTNQGRLQFTLAHELGHIVLGHVKDFTVWNRGEESTNDPREQQANIFASRLLAPACVLRELNIHTAEEISALCGLSKTAAAIRAQRMEELYVREKEWQRKYGRTCFGLSEQERKAMKQFKQFCEKNKMN